MVRTIDFSQARRHKNEKFTQSHSLPLSVDSPPKSLFGVFSLFSVSCSFYFVQSLFLLTVDSSV